LAIADIFDYIIVLREEAVFSFPDLKAGVSTPQF